MYKLLTWVFAGRVSPERAFCSKSTELMDFIIMETEISGNSLMVTTPNKKGLRSP
jgi:hypothetical protein